MTRQIRTEAQKNIATRIFDFFGEGRDAIEADVGQHVAMDVPLQSQGQRRCSGS